MLLAGSTYSVTHTVHNRQFLLTPGPVVNQVVLYCAFRAVRVTGVQLHWLFVHVNHIHLGVTDPDSRLSAFMQAMDRMIAKCLIEYYRQTHPHQHLDAVWSRSSFSAQMLLTSNAVLSAMCYALTNAVKDGQVRDYRTHAAQGIGVRGVKAVLRTDPFDSPNKPRPKGKTNPTVAAGGDTAMLQEGIRLVRNFRERYREAWKAYRAGQREVLFPSGTLLVRTLHGVACDSLQSTLVPT
jgi:hypothetical protein